ncbi:MAG: lipid-A-disaccharide synthase [Verrucomicrobia bacterium]|nr:lipid-A-disaccharide synthase [Verrucomicrobiota bacterium]
MKPNQFMLIAGETSGDLLAAELVRALKQSPQLQAMPFPSEFFGAGGSQLAAAGVELAFDLTQHSVIGISDVVKKYWEFKRFFDRLVHLAIERKPDVIICVDFQAFNRRFAHAVRKYLRARQATFNNWNPKIIQYVSPQVWASRPGRARQLAEDVHLLLSIIPFEKDWYAGRVPKLRVEFVGHPMVERMQNAKCKMQNAKVAPVVLLLPGSRKSELQRHLPVMIEAARIIKARHHTNFRLILPNFELCAMAQGMAGIKVRRELAEPVLDLNAHPFIKCRVGDVGQALSEADLAIASTGTVTLECACFGVPTVAIYKAAWSDYFIAKQIVTVKHLAMPNLLANETIYPELIQGAATPENIAREALDLLSNAERVRAVKSKLATVVKSLGEPGASRRAAEAVLSLLR